MQAGSIGFEAYGTGVGAKRVETYNAILGPPTSFPSPNATQAAVYAQLTTLNLTLDSSSMSSLSDMEATYYYAGLPSSPRLVARTSTTMWAMPKGLEAYRKVKQLGIVVNHKLNAIWETDVAPKVLACLDKKGIAWTSTDIVRIGIVGESAPVVLWIGVEPKSLGSEDAKAAAFM